MSYFSQIIARLAIAVIRLYQRTLSFDHGPLKIFYPHGFCRFHPSCSQYAVGAIGRFGVARGTVKTLGRIFRCNPFNKGGYDPVN